MGPGAIGQFFDMPREEWQACLDCHAPLSEQSDELARYLDDPRPHRPPADVTNPEIVPAAPIHAGGRLSEQGVVCAACHVRAGRWYGPPRREGVPVPAGTSDALPHRGWVSVRAFGDSRFCAACHQFPPDGFSLNGKLLEDTYEEWRVSPQARQGVSCQGCHMPGRRHLFRGIHDPETVRAGVAVGSKSFKAAEGKARVSIFLTNTGTGHRLPTYVTPEIRLEAYQQDAHGLPIPNTGQVAWVARRVDLQLTTEYFDTRLAPGETATLTYEQPISPDARALMTRIHVAPDAFYTRIYEALLEMGLDEQGDRLIRKALAESRRSGFSLHDKHYPLRPATRPGQGRDP